MKKLSKEAEKVFGRLRNLTEADKEKLFNDRLSKEENALLDEAGFVSSALERAASSHKYKYVSDHVSDVAQKVKGLFDKKGIRL